MTVFNVDCREGMKWFPDNTFDSIVCDPPYELGFMGKAWDSTGIAYDPVMWAEALRVLKPGGHLLAFSSSRTYHRMVCAIEDAGFEIRDQIMWIYGSGFPKSLDVAKAIDKARVEDVEPVRVICRAVRAAMDRLNLKSKDLTAYFGDCNPRLIDHWAARDTDSQPLLPTGAQWITLRGLLDIGGAYDAEVARLNERKGQAGDAWQTAEVVGKSKWKTLNVMPMPGVACSAENRSVKDIKAPATEAAQQWQGWGTALKPAHEPICVARKPLIGTVAANVLQFGTGAINIDGCRVETGDNLNGGRYSDNKQGNDGNSYGAGINLRSCADYVQPLGRWPANVIHDGSGEVLAEFPITASGSGTVKRSSGKDAGGNTGAAYGKESRAAGTPMIFYGDTGSAARFFYCAKASRKDRNEGLDDPGPQFKHGATLRDIENTATKGNNHPTVKPTDLMRYLCRLVTPPDGCILDPFAGSGSTGKAAALEGFTFIGFELDAEHTEIANARIKAAA